MGSVDNDLSRFGKAPVVLKTTVRKPAGQIVISEPDVAIQEFDTLQCCHCGMHYRVTPGSGTIRGFCYLCEGLTCGSVKCDECVPTEKFLEIREGRDPTKLQF